MVCTPCTTVLGRGWATKVRDFRQLERVLLVGKLRAMSGELTTFEVESWFKR